MVIFKIKALPALKPLQNNIFIVIKIIIKTAFGLHALLKNCKLRGTNAEEITFLHSTGLNCYPTNERRYHFSSVNVIIR